MMSPAISCEYRDDVALLWIDNPPVNAIGHQVRLGLVQGLERAAADPAIAAVIILCRGKAFSSGADIAEFGAAELEPKWAELDRRIEMSMKPVVAAIHGSALGGGLEVALACHFRIAEGGSSLALPEVKLGLIPGAGGTQRLPRLVGMEKAIDIITSGRNVPAAEALRIGLIDHIAEGDLAEAALGFARSMLLAHRGKPLPRARELPFAAAADDLIANARNALATKYRGFTAPVRALDAIAMAGHLTFTEGMQAEAEIFETCLKTEEHAALSHLFFAECQARKLPFAPASVSPRAIEKVAVIGGGTMGMGIAFCLTQSGLPVRLIERDEAGLAAARSRYLVEIDGAETRGKISADAARQRRDLFAGSVAMADIADCDLIIEAVFEDMSLKRDVFALMDRHSARHAILASNTSSLDLDEIAAATSRPADVVGLHFFSPAHVMSLLEIVRGRATAPDILVTALALARRIRKQPVISGVCDGFIANRIFDQYFREADFLVEEGASPYDVDDALTGFGMPMGPFAVSDLVGLDVGQFIRKRQRAALKPGLRYSTLEDEIVATGRLGRKTGRGWYAYQEGQRTGVCDPEVLSIIERHRLTLGRKARSVSGPEIIERCLFALINEGGKLLDEGIAARASDIDVAAVHGYGFPRYRGGPMKFADTLGLATVATAVERHFREQGEWWRPSPLLLDLARTGQSLAARRIESVVLP